jgi:lariat debranching enzyme
MPAKYRKMADFHEYYSGARRAPYLTIFIGGNHEASNHLFELYYGGWVAPNIYYMGAANILRLGPLRIAGLSGIWKGYDYRKPHFERLPYNEAESVSIFHVRELDVRKMLSVRTQVDIGLSHDWPQGVEWKGDYRELFRKKDRFEADANDGRLGSIAARQCLDRLRPGHWFSAHLHVKYAAIVRHGDYELVAHPRDPHPLPRVAQFERTSAQPAPKHKPDDTNHLSDAYTVSPNQNYHQDQFSRMISKSTEETSTLSEPFAVGKDDPRARPAAKSPKHAEVSAWQNFQVDAAKAEAEDTELWLRAQREKAAEEERNGIRKSPDYVFDETWKQVHVDDGDGRGIAAISKSIRSPGEDIKMINVDGCVESKLKRPRSKSPADSAENGPTTPPPNFRSALSGQLDGHTHGGATVGTRTTKNIDEIEIDLSDSSSEDTGVERKRIPTDAGKIVAATQENGVSSQMAGNNSNKRAKSEAVISDDSDDGGVKLDPTSPPFVPRMSAFFQPNVVQDQGKEDVTLKPETPNLDLEEISDAMRAQLAEISSTFAPTLNQEPISAPLPFPEGIANSKTQFLALDKCERGRDFLQLLEIEPISTQPKLPQARPFKLQYDQEWLAILRVFAPELELGGDAKDKVRPYKGDTYYRERIIEEEKWIEEHVVQADRLTIPENFTITAPVYDANEEVAPTDKPREYTSPQTRVFCDLIGIDNKFDLSEEERQMRMNQGPRPSDRGFSRGGRGGGRGGESGFNSRGRGGRGRGRGGRGRGRGRGRW